MIDVAARLHSDAVATPQPIDDVAKLFGVSRRTMFRLIDEYRIQRHRMPGKGKGTYLDPDEVRRKWKPKPAKERQNG